MATTTAAMHEGNIRTLKSFMRTLPKTRQISAHLRTYTVSELEALRTDQRVPLIVQVALPGAITDEKNRIRDIVGPMCSPEENLSKAVVLKV